MSDKKKDSIKKVIPETPAVSGDTEKKSLDKDASAKTKKPKKKGSKLRVVLIILLILVILAGIGLAVGVGVIYHYIDKINIVDNNNSYEILDSIEPDDDLTSEPDSPQEDIDAIDQMIEENVGKDVNTSANYSVDSTGSYDFDFDDENVYNVLLIGTDARDNTSRGRSDSMILLSINRNTKKIIMTSFLRDIYLYIPNVSNTRLNHAYAYGGADLLIETIETNFKIPIHNYVQVNFFSFITVVDSVGGVEIEITSQELPYFNSYLKSINDLEGNPTNEGVLSSAGTYTLSGAQALAYSRIRYVGTDFARSERQRTVLEQIIGKMSDLSITELGDLLDEILPNVTTDIQRDELFDLVLESPTLLGYDRLMCRVPADNTWWNLTIRSMAVLGIDFETNIRYLGENIYN